MINEMSANEVEKAGRLGINASYKLYCPVSLILDNDDLVQRNGKIYRVKSDPKDTIERGHHHRYFLQFVSYDNKEVT